MGQHLKQSRPSSKKTFKDLLVDGFIAPFTDVPLKGLYLVTLLFAFGLSGSDMFFVLDFAHMGPLAVMKMLLARYTAVCIVLLPLMLLLSRTLSKKWLLGFYLLCPALSVCAIFLLAGTEMPPMVIGTLFGMSAASFWAMYHLCLIAHSSDHNKGNELSIAVNGFNIGSILGFITGGVLSQFEINPFFVAAGGFAILFSATAMQAVYFVKSKTLEMLQSHNSHEESIINAFKKHPKRSWGTFLQGAFDVPSRAAWPLFMTIAGVSAVAAGSIQAFTALFKLAFSPILGHWVNSDSGKEISYGSHLQAAGWLPWIALNTPALVSFSAFVWAIGQHFYDLGLSKRWYSCRSVGGVIARELTLGAGRIFATVGLIPLLLISPYVFAGAAFCVGLLMIHLSYGYIREGLKLAAEAAE